MFIEKECEFCHKLFMADSRELNRGNAKFCCLSCAAKSRNRNKPLKHCKCVVCNSEFLSANPKAKYCSDKCKSKHYRQLIATEMDWYKKITKNIINITLCELWMEYWTKRYSSHITCLQRW